MKSVSLQSIYNGMSGRSRNKMMTLRLFEFFFAKELKRFGLEFGHIDKCVLKKEGQNTNVRMCPMSQQSNELLRT